MGKLEDAPFTIKQALVTTSYPGASPMEVQQQVTDVLEESIQSLGELYYLKTENRAGLSKITVYVKKEIRAKDMQQLWDKLRRKVNDVQNKLPAGAGPSVVNDDFGDVLGVFYGLSSETHTYRELEDCAKEIKNELLEQVQRNFRWMPDLVSLLRKYEERQVKYGSFENFYPRVIDFFEDYAKKENKRLDVIKSK